MSSWTAYSRQPGAAAPRHDDHLARPTLAALPASRAPPALAPICRGYGDEWAADSNDRLTSRYLDLGALSFGVFAIRDRFSGYIVALECVPDMCDGDYLAHVFLDAVEEEQGAPARLVVDNGAENDKLVQVQVTLHSQSAAPRGPDSPPPFETQTPNASLLNLWSQWMRINGRALQRVIKDEALLVGFNPEDDLQAATALFIWRRVIQRSLDDLRQALNNARVCRQPNKAAGLLSGHVPAVARRGWHGGERCIVPCDGDVVRRLHDAVGPRVVSVDPELEAVAQRGWEEMGRPALLRTTAWDVGAQLVERLL